MRILLFFLAGFICFFLASDAFHRVSKKKLYSIPGLFIIVLGITATLWSRYFFYPPIPTLISLFLVGAGLGIATHHLLSQGFILDEKSETNFAKTHQKLLERIIEILPGALTWIALTSPFWLSLTFPYALAYLIILAEVYWLFTAIRTAILIFIGFRKLEWAKSQPWLKLLQKDFPDQWAEYYHLIVLPTYKESFEVLGPAFDAVANSNYPKSKIFLAVGFEERTNPEATHTQTLKYLKQVGQKIGGVLTSIHPANLPGEIPGPGTNRNWIIKNAVKKLQELNIPTDKVFVTTLDCDFVLHPEFLAGALHKYLSAPQDIRDKRTYTGTFLYYNNYWQAPTPMRLISTGTALWQLAEMVGSDKYRNFSSLSINLKSLLEIGLWIPDKVNDDSGFYWKAYFHFHGDYKVIPHFIPVNADSVLDVTLLKTFQNQYLQLKRWAYGVEHFPYVIGEYFRHKEIDFWKKTDNMIFAFWGYFRWGFLALFVTFAGSIISILNPQYNQSVLAINLPIVSSYILTGAFLGLFATIYVHEKTVPPRPKAWPFINKLWSYLQFLLIPLVIVTISTIPAIDAQTTLMIGKKLKFRTTNKARLTT